MASKIYKTAAEALDGLLFDGMTIAADAPVRAEIGAGWRNECVTVDLSASRRYTDTDDVDPSTSFGLSVNLAGFSTGQTAMPAARSCEG